MGNKHKKRWSTLLATGKVQIKTTKRCHFTPIRMATIKTGNDSVGKNVEELELPYTAYENVKWCSYLENSLAVPKG